jgi:hypothetical protein
MAHNPQGNQYGQGDQYGVPQGRPGVPDQNVDPAGNTQMFRAFVNEGGTPQARVQQPRSSGPRVGLIAGVVIVVVVLAAVVWLAV